MRAAVLVVALALVGGCALFRPKELPADRDETRAGVPGGAELEAHLRKRLPGVAEVRLVKLLRWTDRTPGPCTADFSVDEGASRIDARWEVDGERRSLRGADVAALATEGWEPAYRTPNGVGFEKLGRFRKVDATVRQTLECRCFGGERPVARYPTELRFRWREGGLVETSATVERGGKTEALRPALTAGRLVTYEYAVAAPFPEGRAGSCDGHLAVTFLVDPPLR